MAQRETKVSLLTSFSTDDDDEIGSSICMGGYENNPILLDNVPNDFNFGLYELDYSVFDTHIDGAVKLCPTFGDAGIKSTICGPESFTPDHKPLMVTKDFSLFSFQLIVIDVFRRCFL
jgi:glycine/D-amino acid oxidase-like deaminating enzyme